MFEELVKGMAAIPAQLKSAETYCMKMSAEVFQQKTAHFERIDGHFDVDGLIVKYKCNLDGRIYTVKITASK